MCIRFYFLVLLGLCINLKCTDDSGATCAQRVLDADQQARICVRLGEYIAGKDFGRLRVIARLGVTAPKELQADINSLLLVAAHNGSFADVKAMVELGADITAVDEYGNTPIMKAIRPRREEVSKAFKDRFKAAEYLLSFYGQHLDHKNHAGQTMHTLIDATIEKWSRKKELGQALLYKKYDAMKGTIARRQMFNKAVAEAEEPMKSLLIKILDKLSVGIITDNLNLEEEMKEYLSKDSDFLSLPEDEKRFIQIMLAQQIQIQQLFLIMGAKK
jgi:hypothetical protein